MDTLSKKWYQRAPGIIALLIFFFPAGLFLMWKYARWNQKVKWIITGLFAFFFLFTINGPSYKDNSSKVAGITEQSQTTTNQVSPSPSPTPSPSPSISDEPEVEQNQATSNPQVTSPSQAPQTTNKTVKVIKVIDGDTIEIEGGQKVRYIGIDTPETVDPRKPIQCFGKEASVKNKELVAGKQVRLEKDISETDKYGRLLRYIYVEDIFVNDYLVRQGYAHASSYPPDIKYQDQFTQAQNEAKNNSRGLWGSACDVSTQSQKQPTNDANSANNVTTQQSGNCVIKGNISSSGEKIYHMPGQRFYEKTVIDGNKGERWFCSESEAENAGWRKSKV